MFSTFKNFQKLFSIDLYGKNVKKKMKLYNDIDTKYGIPNVLNVRVERML